MGMLLYRVYIPSNLDFQHVKQPEAKHDLYDHQMSRTKCGHVLKRDELEAIQKDISDLVRPSWLTSVPAQLGSPSHGKLKADQWRVLGTTFLPLSLIRLWSSSEKDDERSVRCCRILDVTLSLLSAIAIATSRTTTNDHAEAFHSHLLDYLNGLKELFPDYEFHPNHHMALHLSEYIKFYGPVHSWWTFLFERIIGMLQRISTNYKEGKFIACCLNLLLTHAIGEYEATIANGFTRANNLRNLFHCHGTPEIIRNCEPYFKQLVKPEARSVMVMDILSFTPDDEENGEDFTHRPSTSPLPDPVRSCIQATFERNHHATLLTHLTLGGVAYSTSSKHLGNSYILIKSGTPGKLLPARIDYIVQVEIPVEGGTYQVPYVVACKFLPIELQDDPYRSFTCLRAELWSVSLDELGLYPLDSIEGHFAGLPILWENKNVMVVISLSHVSTYYLSTQRADPVRQDL